MVKINKPLNYKRRYGALKPRRTAVLYLFYRYYCPAGRAFFLIAKRSKNREEVTTPPPPTPPLNVPETGMIGLDFLIFYT